MMTMKRTAQSKFRSVCHQHGALPLFLLDSPPSDDDEEVALLFFSFLVAFLSVSIQVLLPLAAAHDVDKISIEKCGTIFFVF